MNAHRRNIDLAQGSGYYRINPVAAHSWRSMHCGRSLRYFEAFKATNIDVEVGGFWIFGDRCRVNHAI